MCVYADGKLQCSLLGFFLFPSVPDSPNMQWILIWRTKIRSDTKENLKAYVPFLNSVPVLNELMVLPRTQQPTN